MNWTKDKPTKDGNYFMRHGKGVAFFTEVWAEDGDFFLAGDNELYPIRDKAEWLGPFTAEDLIK